MQNERGTGMVSTLVGVTAFLTMLLFATQLVLNLYATSTVTAAAFDGARIVAGSEGGESAEADAEAHVRSLLGRYAAAGTLELSWAYRDSDGIAGNDIVALTVDADHPTRLLRMRLPFQHIRRTVTVRIESFR